MSSDQDPPSRGGKPDAHPVHGRKPKAVGPWDQEGTNRQWGAAAWCWTAGSLCVLCSVQAAAAATPSWSIVCGLRRAWGGPWLWARGSPLACSRLHKTSQRLLTASTATRPCFLPAPPPLVRLWLLLGRSSQRVCFCCGSLRPTTAGSGPAPRAGSEFRCRRCMLGGLFLPVPLRASHGLLS